MIEHVAQYSGGICSFFAAKRMVERYGKDQAVLLFADTMMEDEDLYRFLEETSKHLGMPVTRIADGRTPWQVFKDERFLGNSRVDPCSKILKRELLWKWMEENAPKATAYVGLDWTEEHRLERLRKYRPEFTIESPMMWEPVVDKPDMLVELGKLGIEIPRLYKMGFSHNNCFGGGTRVTTSCGPKTLEELSGKKCLVITSNGWQPATGHCFGKQTVVDLWLKRNGDSRLVRTTRDHRWLVLPNTRQRSSITEVLTRDLKPGDALANFGVPVPSASSDQPLRPDHVAWGVVIGDGTWASAVSSKILLCGEKTELERWFPAEASRIPKPNGLYIGKLPLEWTVEPSFDERDLCWSSFFAGWFAADGRLSPKGAALTVCRSDRVDLALHAAVMAGAEPLGVTEYSRYSNYTNDWRDVYEIRLRHIPHNLVIRSRHLSGWRAQKYQPSLWRVDRIDEVKAQQEVYCLRVPSTEDFSLEFGLGTRNCGGICIKAGQAQFRLLLLTMPERYAYHEQQEEELRSYLQKDVAIMKDRRGGKSRPMTMKEFRERIQSGGEHDRHDWGGCGCAID